MTNRNLAIVLLFFKRKTFMRDIFEKISTNKGPLGQYGEDAFGYYMFPKLEGEIG